MAFPLRKLRTIFETDWFSHFITFLLQKEYRRELDRKGLYKGSEDRVKLPHWDLMKAFSQEGPYQQARPAAGFI
jgi:hypothetical protein